MSNSFTYKGYCVTIETDASAYFPSEPDSLHGRYCIWKAKEGSLGRQVYCGHTGKTYRATETQQMIAAAGAEARAWIDANSGKPWA